MYVCPVCGKENQGEARFCSRCGNAFNARTGHLPMNMRLHSGRYMILKLLGQGGMGAVYQARDMHEPQKIVAVKEMSQSGLSGQELQDAIKAFAHEADMLARLDHSSLPRIYQHFEEGGRWYLVMDFIRGETLEHYEEMYRRKGVRIPLELLLHIGIQLCRVMDYLHSQRPPIIFRDLKPSNSMLTQQGQVYLIDFGIARFWKPNQTHDTLALGSPGYASPEQYQRSTTPKSDIYSLGAMLHQFLTGDNPERNPFRFKAFSVNMPLLEELVMSMVDVDEACRPRSMRDVQDVLERVAHVRNNYGTPASVQVQTSAMRPVSVDIVVSQNAQDWQVGSSLLSYLSGMVEALPMIQIFCRGVSVGREQRFGGATLTLLLLSEDFLQERECMASAKRAIERMRTHSEKVVSFVLRSCLWQATELATVLPMLADPIAHASLYAQEQRILEASRRVFGQIMSMILAGKSTGAMNLLRWILLQLHKNGEEDCPYFVVERYVLKNVRRSGQAGAFLHVVDVYTSRAIADFVIDAHTSARLMDLLRIIAPANTTLAEVEGVAMREQPASLKMKIAWL